jgi:pSer/pThr/pTyr-binding forkhead associated (FHA) protein
MKVSLVVASGVHQGKVVPIVGPQFLVGRDPQCQLRPASQAVSKQHCAVIVRDGKVFLKDFGSTNGTTLNEVVVQGEERPLNNNDSVKIGPLDFFIRIEADAIKDDGTPLPDMHPEGAAALAAVKAVAKPSTSRNQTPNPGSKETPAMKPKAPAATGEDAEQDRLAAMLLGLDDGEVPGGSTIADMPVPTGVTEGEKAAEKPAEKKAAVPSREDTSSAASEILRKYMRRPK